MKTGPWDTPQGVLEAPASLAFRMLRGRFPVTVVARGISSTLYMYSKCLYLWYSDRQTITMCMEGSNDMHTLHTWMEQPEAAQYRTIDTHSPMIGIHDVASIAGIRWELWSLSDYYVSSVQAGVIWVAPRSL